jgi:hypothetical protein
MYIYICMYVCIHTYIHTYYIYNKTSMCNVYIHYTLKWFHIVVLAIFRHFKVHLHAFEISISLYSDLYIMGWYRIRAKVRIEVFQLFCIIVSIIFRHFKCKQAHTQDRTCVCALLEGGRVRERERERERERDRHTCICVIYIP